MITTLCEKIVTSVSNTLVDLTSDTPDVSDAFLRESRMLYIGILVALLGLLHLVHKRFGFAV